MTKETLAQGSLAEPLVLVLAAIFTSYNHMDYSRKSSGYSCLMPDSRKAQLFPVLCQHNGRMPRAQVAPHHMSLPNTSPPIPLGHNSLHHQYQFLLLLSSKCLPPVLMILWFTCIQCTRYTYKWLLCVSAHPCSFARQFQVAMDWYRQVIKHSALPRATLFSQPLPWHNT